MFSKKKGTKLQSWCKQCSKEHHKKHYQENKERYRKLSLEWRRANAAWFKEYKSNLVCAKCPENHPGCLDFHHHNGSKESNVSQMVYNANISTVLREIEQCIVLCANCHRKLHYEERITSASPPSPG
jgi:hypothetical protein